jgi:hypothetical protein
MKVGSCTVDQGLPSPKSHDLNVHSLKTSGQKFLKIVHLSVSSEKSATGGGVLVCRMGRFLLPSAVMCCYQVIQLVLKHVFFVLILHRSSGPIYLIK